MDTGHSGGTGTAAAAMVLALLVAVGSAATPPRTYSPAPTVVARVEG